MNNTIVHVYELTYVSYMLLLFLQKGKRISFTDTNILIIQHVSSSLTPLERRNSSARMKINTFLRAPIILTKIEVGKSLHVISLKNKSKLQIPKKKRFTLQYIEVIYR